MIKDSPELIDLRAKFRTYYDNELYQRFADMEKMRKRYLLSFWILLIITVIVLPVFSLLFMANVLYNLNLDSGYNDIILFAIIGIITILCAPNVIYKRKAKLNVMEHFIKFFGSFSYKQDYTIDNNTIYKSKLFSTYNVHTGDDLFVGRYKDVEITISEERLKTETIRGKRRHVETVFKGIMVLLGMNKKFKGQTVVKKDRGWLMNKFLRHRGSKTIKLEDVVFEKQFEVFSDDQIEARYLLTTGFMDRMVRLRDTFNSKKMEFSFFENKLFVAVSTGKNMFETSSIFKSSTDYKSIEKVFDQFYAVFSIVDILKLDKKI